MGEENRRNQNSCSYLTLLQQCGFANSRSLKAGTTKNRADNNNDARLSSAKIIFVQRKEDPSFVVKRSTSQ